MSMTSFFDALEGLYGGAEKMVRCELQFADMVYTVYKEGVEDMVRTAPIIYQDTIKDFLQAFKRLSKLVEDRTEQIEVFALESGSEDFTASSRWLKDWFGNYFRDKQSELAVCIMTGDTAEKLKALTKLLDTYDSYFESLDSEDEGVPKYDEMFNSVIQVPAEVIRYIRSAPVEGSSCTISVEYVQTREVIAFPTKLQFAA